MSSSSSLSSSSSESSSSSISSSSSSSTLVVKVSVPQGWYNTPVIIVRQMDEISEEVNIEVTLNEEEDIKLKSSFKALNNEINIGIKLLKPLKKIKTIKIK